MRKNYKLFFGISAIGVTLLALVFLKNVADATNVPTIVSYQGKLLESGVSVTTTKAMAFLLYDSLTSGNLLYTAAGSISATSTISKVPENGIFTVQLGGAGTNSLDASIFQNNSAIYLEVWVAGQKLTPRKQITTSPYAFNSQYLMGFSATTTSSTVYIPISDAFGNFTFTGTASTTGVNGGIIYINPTSAGTDKTLFGIADNGTERFRVDKEGDAWVFGALNVSSTLNVITTSTFATTTMTSSTITTANVGSLYVNGNSVFAGASSTNIDTSGYLNVDSGTFYVDNLNNRVGINSSTPKYDLAVNGTSWFTGTSTMANWFEVQGRVGNPIHKGSLSDTVGGAVLDSAESVYVSGNYAYVVSLNSDALEIIDISNPASPVHKGKIVSSTLALLDGAIGVYVSGNYAYVASFNNNALEIIDISNPSSPTHKGSLRHGAGGSELNFPYSVYVSGNYAYVVSSVGNSLEIVDISDPSNPKHKGSLLNGVGGALLSAPFSVTVSGNYAYVASSGSDALEIVDVSDPSNPKHKGSLVDGAGVAPYLDSPYSVYVSGNYAYVGSAGASMALEIVDISNPAAPSHKGSLLNGVGGAKLTTPMSVYVSGNYAYVAAQDSDALEIIDISNPATPSHKGSLSNTVGSSLLDGATSVFVSGNYAYVASYLSDALEIIDISGTTISNAEIGTTKTSNLQVMSSALFDKNVNIRGGLSIGSNGLLLSGDFGMSSPTTTDVTTATNTLNFSHTTLFKTQATTTDEAAFIFDTANTLTASNLLSVRNNGTVRLVLNESGNLGINTTTPAFNLSVSGTMYVSGLSTIASVSTTNIDASGYLNVDSGTFYVDNANNRVGINSSTPKYDLAVNGTSWFTGTSTVANWFEVQGRVGNPIHKGSLRDGSGPPPHLSGSNSVYVSGNYAYVTSQTSNALEIIDISNPAAPTHKGLLDNGSGSTPFLNLPNYVTVSGNYAYIASYNSDALEIIDISNPAAPTHKGSLLKGSSAPPYLDGAQSVAVSGNYAYVASSNSDALEIVDISNPSAPLHVGSLLDGGGSAPFLNGANSVYISGNYAYVVSTVSAALEIIDISNPSVPLHKGSLSNGGGALLDGPISIFVSGNYAYIVSTGSNALEIVDISNPASPVHKGSLSNGGGASLLYPSSVFVSGNYAYVASFNSNALEIVDISSSTAPTHKGSLSNGGGSAPYLSGPLSVFVSGNYAYVVGGSSALEIVDISGSTISNAEIGTTKTTNLQVMNNGLFDQNVSIRGALSVGSNGLLLSGDFGMSSPTSTDTLTATNTLSFSHTALFKSSATATEPNLFIFDTTNAFSTSASTTYLLSVRNNGTPEFSVASNGDATVKGRFFASSASIGVPFTPGDLAEKVDISSAENVEPGDVMIVDPDSTDSYKRSATAYDNRVAGVISTQPSIIVGDARTEFSAVMAMVGRVPIKTSTENGAIMRGDLLVSASTPGYAMKYDSTKDDEGRVVGIIGVALEPLATSTGKIMALVRTGWINNRNQTLQTMQGNISTIAAATNVAIQNNLQNLTIEQNTSGKISYSAGQNLDLNNSLIINVTGIVGANGKWQIDEDGRFVTKVAGANGNSRSLYAMQSEQTDMIISGTSALENGMKKIEFDELNSSIINPEKSIKVSITLTSEANGVFVTDKNEKGFTVKELNNGKNNASFDWVVIAERKIGDTEITNVAPTSSSENNPEPPSTSENTTSTPQIDTPQNITPNSSSSTEPVSPASQNDTTVSTQNNSNSDESSSQIINPIVPTDEPPTETSPSETPAPMEMPSASM